MRKAGAKDYKLYSKQILKICKNRPVFLEVFADDQKLMIDQVKTITVGKIMYTLKYLSLIQKIILLEK
jgi:transaldolase